MEWLETIKVQAGGGRESILAKELAALAHEVGIGPDSPGRLKVAVYSRVLVPGQLAISLFWDTERPEVHGSAIGLSLARSLKAFGLVDHSVWTRQE